jgi:hypothetical protein
MKSTRGFQIVYNGFPSHLIEFHRQILTRPDSGDRTLKKSPEIAVKAYGLSHQLEIPGPTGFAWRRLAAENND